MWKFDEIYTDLINLLKHRSLITRLIITGSESLSPHWAQYAVHLL